MESGRFHHGNLRRDLIDQAVADLRHAGFTALSLRELAQRIGVSTAAPYRHFASKADLLRAVAAEGHAQVMAAYRAAAASDAPPLARLRTACAAYLDLAIDNQGLFELLFFTLMYAGRPEGAPHAEGSALEAFEDLVACRHGLTDRAVVRRSALAAWSMLHGFATLRAHGQLAHVMPEAAMREAVLDAAVTICV